MNILHFLTSLETHGGTSAKVKLLIKKSTHTHIIFVPEIKNSKFPNQVQEWKDTGGIIIPYHGNLFENLFSIRTIIKKYHIQIVHCYFPPQTVAGTLIKIICPRIKLIRSFEGNVILSMPKRIATTIALRLFDKIIFISEYVKNYYLKIYPFLGDKENCIIYNSAVHQHSISQNIFHDIYKKKLVCVAGLNPSKNPLILIEAVRILKEKGKECQLYFLGDGPLRPKMEELITKYGLNENIILLGYSSEVIKYLDESSIYVHSADNEGFGIAVLEAMERKCAVILSKAGGLTELIEENVSGIFAQPYDATDWAGKIDMLLNNQELVNKLGEEAYKQAISKFSIDKFINLHDNLYSYLINTV